jgi:hypothetical protein
MAKAKTTTTPKSDQDNRTIDRNKAEDLACNVAGVLNNEACPDHLRAAITDALCELQTRSECLSNVDFLLGLFLAKTCATEETGGAS